ncbi:oxidation resistance protein 1 isoform X1 [Oncorhynchus mykiss]|uniref:oxidation resistance protein 1 isoform X1 n=1 Tax=Oncorhynchus mykiss TaxID=8022 RepID=UPI001877EE52|nr:oxidation resistance protein 1 isoform X1 [Oncorhynchus mykiss]
MTIINGELINIPVVFPTTSIPLFFLPSRLGSKLPVGDTQSPRFISRPLETGPQTDSTKEARANGQGHRAVGRPLDHVPHIRNPRLRQYYLQEPRWGTEGTMAKSMGRDHLSDDKVDTMAHHEDTVFSVTSKCSSLADQTKLNRQLSISSSLISRQNLRVPKSKGSGQCSSPAVMHLDPNLRLEPELDTNPGLGLFPAPSASPHSPSPDAEYDKLLDVEAVPMPDGQLCLLALPPECSQREGQAAMPYLKLFCRYITDRKGVVSGILLVTSNKIFFDPCKTHPLVMEHGCEEYLLSCSVDSLDSASFYSDISHVHFNTSTYRWKGTKKTQKTLSKTDKTLQQGGRRSSRSPQHKRETVPVLVSAATSELRSALALSLVQGFAEEESSSDMTQAEKQLEGKGSPLEELVVQSSGAELSSFCCGGQVAAGTRNRVRMEQVDREGTEKEQSVRNQTSGLSRPSGTFGCLMFVRLRLQGSAGKKGVAAGLQLGTTKTLPRRDAWFAFSQESSDELYAYLSHWRPDLCVLEGGSEEGEGDKDEFVLVDNEEEEEEVSKNHGRTGEDWEMVSVEDGGGRLPLVMDKDPEGLCEIVEQSRILDATLVRELSAELPPRTVGHMWHLAYSTSLHGSSLKSLYRKLNGSDSPVLMVIKDSLNQVFGSFLSHPLRPSETFYGTGETFLFMLHPRFKCFRWTRENSFFIKGDLDSFAIGGGSGHFGLWLDETLYLGRSSPCYTFNNCCLSERDDFHVIELEVWTFW